MGWFGPPFFLLAVLLGAGIAWRGPLSIFGLALGLLAFAPALWILISALWPARAERACPACSSGRLVRADPGSTVGIRCDSCGWHDDTASAWLLAEEEGPLEEIVLREREKRRPDRWVDSTHRAD